MPDTMITDVLKSSTPAPKANGHVANGERLVRTIEVDWEADPVASGLVTAAELVAMRRHHTAMSSKNVQGHADGKALHALAVLNTWPLNPAVAPGSVRYWALIAHHEKAWAAAREGCVPSALQSKLSPRERSGQEVLKHSLQLGCPIYYPYSAFARVLAAEIGDDAWLKRIRAIPREERREMLLQWRARQRVALKATLRAIAKYRAALTAPAAVHAAA